jgi:ribosomal-protein-alanine N-acetyltransferase
MSLTEQMLTDISALASVSTMTEHDLLEVVEIEEHSGLSRWGWAAYYAELQSNNRALMLVSRVRRPLDEPESVNLAGYIVARFSAGELHINNVAVREAYRRRGIACELLTRILGEGQRLGASAAFLEVRAENAVARALYEKCGFGVIARRRNYYSEPIEDALVMRALLSE